MQHVIAQLLMGPTIRAPALVGPRPAKSVVVASLPESPLIAPIPLGRPWPNPNATPNRFSEATASSGHAASAFGAMFASAHSIL